MMKSYEKGKLPQIIWGSKSADRVGTELKSADVQKCLIVSGSHVIKHPITQKIIHSFWNIESYSAVRYNREKVDGELFK